MTTTPPAQTPQLIAHPDMKTFMDQTRRGALLQTNCHAIGTISDVSKLASQRTVSATINYSRVVNGAAAPYAIAATCPLLIPGGGTGKITFPVKVGDTCMLFFNDVNMTKWLSTGTVGSTPADLRSHSFSDGVIFVGLDSIPAAALLSYFLTGVEVAYEEGGTSIQLTDTVKLFNAVTDLKSVLNGMLDLMAAITVTPGSLAGPSSPPLNAMAINGYKTTIAGLLT